MAARNAWLIRDLHCDVKAKFHYTGQTRPDRTHADFFSRPGPQTRVSEKVRGLCLVGSGRARVVEFSLHSSNLVCTMRAIADGGSTVDRPPGIGSNYRPLGLFERARSRDNTGELTHLPGCYI